MEKSFNWLRSRGRGNVARIFKVASPLIRPGRPLSPTISYPRSKGTQWSLTLGYFASRWSQFPLIVIAIIDVFLPRSLGTWISLSAKMKAIFIGFCSDFKWICGSILNAEVRQASLGFRDPEIRIQPQPPWPWLRCLCGYIVFIQICMFISFFMRNYENLPAVVGRRRHTWPTAVECFRSFEACNYGLWFVFNVANASSRGSKDGGSDEQGSLNAFPSQLGKGQCGYWRVIRRNLVRRKRFMSTCSHHDTF